MKSKKVLLGVLALFIGVSSIQAQKAKKERVGYKYLRKPLQDLDESIKNYTVVSEVEWAAEEMAKEKAYQDDLIKADEEYEAATTAYNNKKTGSKILEAALLNQKKPVKRVVTKPYIRPIPTATEISSQISLDGYNRGTTDNVTIKVILQQSTIGVPEQKKKVKSEVTYYYYEASVTQPISYEMIDASGNVFYTETVASTTTPRTVTSKEYKAAEWATFKNTGWQPYYEGQINSVTRGSLSQAKSAINNQFGFSKISRTAEVYTGAHKKHNYDSQVLAAKKAQRAYENLLGDREGSIEKLSEAIAIWVKELKDSKPNDKKARINGQITQSLYCNLTEAYITIGDYSKAEDFLDKLDIMGDGGKKKFERQAEWLRKFMKDERNRNQ